MSINLCLIVSTRIRECQYIHLLNTVNLFFCICLMTVEYIKVINTTG